jgi:hypothetical protein
MALAEDRVIVTEEDVRSYLSALCRTLSDLVFTQSRRICRKTDIHVLTLLCWGKPRPLFDIFAHLAGLTRFAAVYFLQILDKSVIGYSAVFGLRANAGLVENQYS